MVTNIYFLWHKRPRPWNPGKPGFIFAVMLLQSVYILMIEDRTFLKERFGISYLRPYQELTISHIFEAAERNETGRILCVLPTGSGKSLCFMYPIAVMRKRSIIIYPLLSLMNDQAERFRACGIPHVLLRGGLGQDERKRLISSFIRCSDAVMITNPEMLISMKKRGELKAFRDKTELLVIDEVHTAVTWGESFRSSYLLLPEIIKELKPHIILAFTATMDERIEKGITEHIFGGREASIVRCSSDRENIFYHAVKSLSKMQDAVKILMPRSSRPAVIFCRSRNLAEETATYLSRYFETRHYHAGMGRDEKIDTETWFGKSETAVLASTSAYGMGVDKKNIRTIIHLSLPFSASDFLQESGRGGRDGRRMDSYVLYSDDEDTPLSTVFKKRSCIRTGLLHMMNEETETDGCLACSSCTDDGYIRAGEQEILRYLLFHPLSSIDNASAALSSPSIFSRRLCTWSEEEIRKAIITLAEEGKIRRMGKRVINMSYW